MNKKRIALVTMTLLATTLLAPALVAAEPTIDADVVYGHKMGMALTFDVLRPADANGAAVLFMVSGGWVSRWFDPAQAATSSMFGPFSALLDGGYTLFLVRHGSSPMFKVPEAVEDVKNAVRYVRANAEQWGVDESRLGVFGGSAGGHLSLMLGNDSDGGKDSGSEVDRTSNRVAAVVAYFPPVDLRQIVGPSDRFPALDFDTELADDVSPLLFVSEDDPPTLLVHGTADTLVPMSNSELILAAFQEKKVPTDLVVIEGGGHGFRGEHAEIAGKALVEWFDRYLADSGATATSSH